MSKQSIYILHITLLCIAISYGQSLMGTAHDFSNDLWNPGGEACIVCHLSHNADETVSDAPLWSHKVTSASYTVYHSSTLDATVGQPSGLSKLCLSCHDGTIALDNFNGLSSGGNFLNGVSKIGTDLSDDHPVSFIYDADLAYRDGELADPGMSDSGLGGTINSDMLSNQRMECTSCHDVHGGGGSQSLLVMNNRGSALCLTCHRK